MLGKWFNKKDEKTKIELEATRKKLDEKFKHILGSHNIVETVESEIISIGQCWSEIHQGIQVSKPKFPFDVEKTNVIIVTAVKGACIKPHKHFKPELIHIISGVHKNTVTNKVNVTGEVIKIKTGEVHGSEFLEDSILIVQWPK